MKAEKGTTKGGKETSIKTMLYHIMIILNASID